MKHKSCCSLTQMCSSRTLSSSLFLFSFILLGIFNILLKHFLLNSCTSFRVKNSQHSLEVVVLFVSGWGDNFACAVSCLWADPPSNIPLSIARSPHHFPTGFLHLENIVRPFGITSVRAYFGHGGITSRVKR